jgi:hypothetical protein
LNGTLINTNFEIRYWSEKFDVSAEQLKAAVKKVGSSVSAVEKELKAG